MYVTRLKLALFNVIYNTLVCSTVLTVHQWHTKYTVHKGTINIMEDEIVSYMY